MNVVGDALDLWDFVVDTSTIPMQNVESWSDRVVFIYDWECEPSYLDNREWGSWERGGKNEGGKKKEDRESRLGGSACAKVIGRDPLTGDSNKEGKKEEIWCIKM